MASLEVIQDMISSKEEAALKAFTGLEGGLVASGSTCGVVTGGAFGLALMHKNEIANRGIEAKLEVLSLIREYSKWFEDSYGSSFCRERSGVNFYTTMGQLRYFVPGDKVGKCLWHIRGAIKYLQDFQRKDLTRSDTETIEIQNKPIHCAQTVLKGVKDRTGINDLLLEKLSFIFDGGVGLQGGVCGALAGAVLAINLLLGMDIRNSQYFNTLKAFIVGHINLLIDKSIGKPEPFCVGKNIVQGFKETFGSTDCRDITGKNFSDWAGFQKHISSSDKCTRLIEFATTEASDAIQELI